MPLRSRRRWSSALLLTTAAVLLAACGTSATGGSGGSAPPPPHTDLPVPRADAITFYLSLPGPPGNSLTGALADAAFAASTPGNPQYRHFSSLADVAARFGASEAQIDAADKAIRAAGLEFAADPTRLFARVSGTPERWAPRSRPRSRSRPPPRTRRSPPTASRRRCPPPSPRRARRSCCPSPPPRCSPTGRSTRPSRCTPRTASPRARRRARPSPSPAPG